MALDRNGATPPASLASKPNASPFVIAASAVQRYDEAVFCVAPDGAIEPSNPVAAELAANLSREDLSRLAGAAIDAKGLNHARVDMLDVGLGETQQNLQVTLMPLEGGRGTLVFVRDLTLDNSLRRALVDSRRRYKDFIEISTDFSWETSADGRFAFVPPRGALGHSADGLMAMDPAALVVAESAIGGEVPFLTQRRIENEESWLRYSDGRSACVVVSAMPLFSKDGQWAGARGVCRDVTETRDREATLTQVRNRERVLTRIVRAFRDEVNPEAMLGVAAKALAKGLGAENCHIFRGVPEDTGSGAVAAVTPGFELAARYGDLDAAAAAPVLTALAGGAGAVEMLSGNRQVLASPARYQSNSNGAVVLWRGVERGAWSDDDRLLIGDIANQIGITIEQLTHHEYVLRISRTDVLTGLLNRGAFMAALQRFLVRMKREHGQGMLMYIDLDNFKHVNDTRGHQAGDEVLMKIREILVQGTRPTDAIARLGGDEFAVWLNGADIAIAKMRATQFLARTKELGLESGSPDRPLGMSIGIAAWDPDGDEDLESLVARADAAMYESKRGGKGTFCVAAPAIKRGSGV